MRWQIWHLQELAEFAQHLWPASMPNPCQTERAGLGAAGVVTHLFTP